MRPLFPFNMDTVRSLNFVRLNSLCTQKRQQALKEGRLKSLQNQAKSRRQREQESREDGLSKSLFERAKLDNDAGANKALGIMMKMGFQLGQSLGKPEDIPPTDVVSLPDTPRPSVPEDSRSHSQAAETRGEKHKSEPLPLSEWTGKKGIGLGKRPRSPGASERIAKMVKMAEESKQENFRDRSRREYEERHAESRLVLAQRTCSNLDEKAGITFNVFWINPNITETIPLELMNLCSEPISLAPVTGGSSETTRLRNQMRADALVPLSSAYDDDEDEVLDRSSPTAQIQGELMPETVEEAMHFLQLGPRDRLNLVLTYLREKYVYCFWCGIQYQDEDDMRQHCPGSEEEDHD